MTCKPPIRSHSPSGEEGFLLVAMIFAVALILIFLAVAAPTVAKDLQREREIEMVHRGNEYVRAIRLYCRKNNGQYPTSIDQLVGSGGTPNIRFLRKKYVDPMTGKDDWRIIHVGENKTNVTGFFGQPLAGLTTSGGLGSATGNLSTTGGSSASTGSTFGSSTFGSSNSSASNSGSSTFGSSTFGSSSSSGSNNSTGGTGTSGTSGTSDSSSTSGVTSTDATKFGGGGGPIMGVSSLSTKTSIISIHDQTTYDTWEFLYDPRIEALYKGNIMGGSIGSAGGGNSFCQQNGIGTPATGTTGTTGTPGGNGSTNGSTSGSGGLWGGSSSN